MPQDKVRDEICFFVQIKIIPIAYKSCKKQLSLVDDWMKNQIVRKDSIKVQRGGDIQSL